MEEARVQMVDVSGKKCTKRVAEATAKIILQKETITLLKEGKIEKGDVLSCAKIAAIMGAKNVYNIIPLCHPILLDAVDVNFLIEEEGVQVRACVKAVERTGVEMEALFAATVAALTIYDMCKGVDKSMRIEYVKLVKKEKE